MDPLLPYAPASVLETAGKQDEVIRLKAALNEKEMELIEMREQHMQLVVSKGSWVRRATASCMRRCWHTTDNASGWRPSYAPRTALHCTAHTMHLTPCLPLCRADHACTTWPAGAQPGGACQLGDCAGRQGQGHRPAGGGAGQQAARAGERPRVRLLLAAHADGACRDALCCRPPQPLARLAAGLHALRRVLQDAASHSAAAGNEELLQRLAAAQGRVTVLEGSLADAHATVRAAA